MHVAKADSHLSYVGYMDVLVLRHGCERLCAALGKHLHRKARLRQVH